MKKKPNAPNHPWKRSLSARQNSINQAVKKEMQKINLTKNEK